MITIGVPLFQETSMYIQRLIMSNRWIFIWGFPFKSGVPEFFSSIFMGIFHHKSTIFWEILLAGHGPSGRRAISRTCPGVPSAHHARQAASSPFQETREKNGSGAVGGFTVGSTGVVEGINLEETMVFTSKYGGFHKWGYPKMDGLRGEIPFNGWWLGVTSILGHHHMIKYD